jgi:hypothetical protein
VKSIVQIVKALELLGAVATSLAMFACFTFGVIKVGQGLEVATSGLFDHVIPSGPTLLDPILAGLEMFFLAPLPFLAFRSITKLYQAILNNSSADLDAAHVLVVHVKRLITGLMIAVVATELIHRIITDKELAFNAITAMLGLIVALTLYYWASAPKEPLIDAHEAVRVEEP